MVSKDDVAASETKHKSSKRTWFTLTIELLNSLLN